MQEDFCKIIFLSTLQIIVKNPFESDCRVSLV